MAWVSLPFRRSQPRFAGENLKHNLRLADQIQSLAADNEITPAQLAVAWVLHQGHDIIPIPGTKRVKYLEENLAAAQIHLGRDELARVGSTVNEPAGERYVPAGMRAVGI